VVPAGGFAPDRTRWMYPKCAGFFLPKTVLSEVFRGKFTEALKGLFRQNKLAFYGSLAFLREPRCFARFLQTLHVHKWVVYVKKPFGGPEHVLHYLARYTHRVAISNHRLLGMEDGKVTFRWKDYAHGGKQCRMTLAAEEFSLRFLLHVLPKNFVRIQPPPPPAIDEVGGRRCPDCGGILEVVEMISLAGYHVGGPAEDVHRTPLKASFLLAGHAGRCAWMFDVCPRVRAYDQIGELRPYPAANRALSGGWATLRGRLRPTGGSSFEYQNSIRNPYGLLPRPPQTQAAHFKRLYRK
jgi:putative transposase